VLLGVVALLHVLLVDGVALVFVSVSVLLLWAMPGRGADEE
jgi:hypothetical protein